jgi:hypothetical protein
VKHDGTSPEKQKQNSDMLSYHGVEEVSSVSKPSTISMMERLDYSVNIVSYPAGESMVKERVAA